MINQPTDIAFFLLLQEICVYLLLCESECVCVCVCVYVAKWWWFLLGINDSLDWCIFFFFLELLKGLIWPDMNSYMACNCLLRH